MTKSLTLTDIDTSVRDQVYTQDYSQKPVIDGVRFLTIKNMTGEDGDFCEILRFGPQGKLTEIPGFTAAQINHSTQFSGSVKAWHLHFLQNEIWFVPPASDLLVGLWDVRNDSPTKGVTMRFAMGGGQARAVYIPHGVAHGSANLSETRSTIIYVVDQQFDSKNPDEHRIPWDAKGADFWHAQRD